MNFAKLARQSPRGPVVAVVMIGSWLAASEDSLAQIKSPATEPPSHAAADLPADPECLTVSQSSASTYIVTNTACPNQSVLAAIELAGEGDRTRCFTKMIRSQISIASEIAAPVINYQCIEGARGCSAETLRGMFPECHAG